ncbi:hypothetical protein WG8_1301 [Paenibacillus sp. Aloe-11]|nr:hypothetical protein WG8_1301 [Paenibacillus sp. Aloe-11]
MVKFLTFISTVEVLVMRKNAGLNRIEKPILQYPNSHNMDGMM